MKKNGFWFYLEPFVHTAINGDKALVYNTINGEKIELSNPFLIKLIKDTQYYKNQGVVYLSKSIYNQQYMMEFVEELRTKFIGNIIDVNLMPDKPIQFIPIPKIYRGTVKQKSDPYGLVAENILSYLQQLYLKINNQCKQSCSDCSYSYKQNFHCSSGKCATEMPFEQIEKIHNMLNTIPLQRIYITGGNIFQHSRINELIQLFSDIKDYCIFSFHLLNMPNEEILQKLSGYHVEVFITQPFNVESVKEAVQLFEQYKINYQFKISITSDADVKFYNKLSKLFPKDFPLILEPLFTGSNHDFFAKHVFINKEDIFAEPIPLNRIFANQILNSNFFGSLYIDTDGSVKSNLNAKKKLGNIDCGSFYPLIAEELINNYSWKKIRNKKPCSNCVYCSLCPAISNYEYAMNRTNLCNIYQE